MDASAARVPGPRYPSLVPSARPVTAMLPLLGSRAMPSWGSGGQGPHGRVLALSNKQDDIKIPLPAKLVVGAIAGMIGTTVAFPLDMVKTRLQSQKIGPTGERAYRGAFHCASTILKTEGFRGLYKGLGANLAGVAPEKAIKLTVNEFFREKFANPDGSIEVQYEALSGALAGFCQVTATNPMEITKIRMQMQALQPPEKRMNTMQVVRNLGVRGMYHGAGSTLMRDIPYSILFFPTYAHLKHLFADGKEGVSYIVGVFLAGGGGAALAAAACTPMDVVKTRLQVPGARQKYTGMMDVWRQVLKNEGVSAFFKGVGPRAIVQTPLFGFALLAFEVQKNYMRSQMEKQRDEKEKRQ